MSRTNIWGLVTGYSLLLMALVAGFAFGYVHNTVYVPSDPISTHDALKNNLILFRFGVASWVLIVILDIVISVGIYVVYYSTNSKWAALVAMMRLAYTAALVMAVTQLIILLLNDELQNGLVYLDLFETIWSYGLIVFGLHLLALGLICWKSDFTPIFVSVLLVLAGLSYVLIESSNSFVSVQPLIHLWAELVLTISMVVGELIFAAWLVIRSTRLTRNKVKPTTLTS